MICCMYDYLAWFFSFQKRSVASFQKIKYVIKWQLGIYLYIYEKRDKTVYMYLIIFS